MGEDEKQLWMRVVDLHIMRKSEMFRKSLKSTVTRSKRLHYLTERKRLSNRRKRNSSKLNYKLICRSDQEKTGNTPFNQIHIRKTERLAISTI